jgi:hypothetical protein
MDLYQNIIEISNFYNIEDFQNGFFCFEEIRNKEILNNNNNNNNNLENFINKINKILYLTNKLKYFVEENLKRYYNKDIKDDFYLKKEAEDLKKFNLINICNVIIEEKTVIYYIKINIYLFLL